MGLVPEPDADVTWKDYCCFGLFFIFMLCGILLRL